MSFLETGEERAARLYQEGQYADWLGSLVGDHGILGHGITCTNDHKRLNMHHKPSTGEVSAMRATMARFEKMLTENGHTPAQARARSLNETRVMERRLERGPKK